MQSLAGQTATVMVGDKHVAGLTVEADEIVLALGILAPLNHKPEIDGNTLITYRRTHRSLGAGRLLA